MPPSEIVMWDAIDLSQIPAAATAVAGYADGRWPTFARLRGQFPHALRLSIAVTAGADAECLDIETGDATPAYAAAWYVRQKARGIARPCLYASASVMESDVVPVMRAAGVDRAGVRLWAAHYTGVPHICGPSSCRAMSVAADGCQWTNRALGRDLDESLLAADFFAVAPPAPKPPSVPAWQEALMQALPELSEGAIDQPGHTYFVHRMQALVQVIGQIKNIADAAAVDVDGDFGPATTLALKAVQASWGLAADGVCGSKSWSVLVTGAQ